jgi:hypothetical protein
VVGGTGNGDGAMTLPVEERSAAGRLGSVPLRHVQSGKGESGSGFGPALSERTRGDRCLYGVGARQCLPDQPIQARRVAA